MDVISKLVLDGILSSALDGFVQKLKPKLTFSIIIQ